LARTLVRPGAASPIGPRRAIHTGARATLGVSDCSACA